MSERNGYAPGTPCWVDVSSTDIEGSKRFYSELFGWNAFTVPAPEADGYTLFDLRGKQVAGLGPSQEEWGPPAWSTYIWSDDADETASRVSDAGGTVLMGPMDVMDAGRMVFAKDPTGGVFGVWQAGRSAARSSRTSPARSPGTSSPPGTRARPRTFTARCSARELCAIGTRVSEFRFCAE